MILIQSGRMPTHSGCRKPSSGEIRWASVRRRPLSLTRDRSLVWSLRSGAVEKRSSDLLAVSERNVDLKRFSPAEIAGVALRLLVMELKQSVFNVLHEDLEQSFLC